MTLMISRRLVLATAFAGLLISSFAIGEETQPLTKGTELANGATFDTLEREYRIAIQPLLARFCLKCHSTGEKKGELDLERFDDLEALRAEPLVWRKVIDQLETDEMPPKKLVQPSPDENAKLLKWARRYLDAEARSHADDPGPVVLRRLSNSEYTYTLRDLTDVDTLDPAREFPVDGAAGEGFTNVGSALVMSPGLVSKYLAAAKSVANHAVLLPSGKITFSAKTTARGWTDERLVGIKSIYDRYANDEGRIDLTPYVRALLRQSSRLTSAEETSSEDGDSFAIEDAISAIAREENVPSVKYLRVLTRTLFRPGVSPPSPLLDALRAQVRDASANDVAATASAIARNVSVWQNQLFRFQPVGHFGLVRPYQQPRRPLESRQTLRLELAATADDADIVVRLAVSTAGDGPEGDRVLWRRPRIEAKGRPTTLLVDVRAGAAVIERKRSTVLSSTARCLDAAFPLRDANAARPDLAQLAVDHDVDPAVLGAWIRYLGLDGEATLGEHLTHPTRNIGGKDHVHAWGLQGVGDLSLVSNASDETVAIPGQLEAHRVCVHPRPERWVGAAWRSPLSGVVRVETFVHDRHGCGNGVAWSLELYRRRRRIVLRSGVVDPSRGATIPSVTSEVSPGDLLALVIDARDGDHSCDLTEIDLTIIETEVNDDDEPRVWSLATDCADSLHAGNPHPDRYGNDETWSFVTGLTADRTRAPALGDAPLLLEWFEAKDADEAARIARRLEALIVGPAPPAGAPGAKIHTDLTTLRGPLFREFDVHELAGSATAEDIRAARHGLSRSRFVDDDLTANAPETIEFTLPAALFAGSTLVLEAELAGAKKTEGSVQLRASTAALAAEETLFAGAPVLVADGGEAAERFEATFQEFRELFPAAVCYAPIVPVDEVVTLVLFHREDEHLKRLFLSPDESAELDRLWRELRFVSADAITMLTGYEQLIQFATQDDDPRRFTPLKPTIDARAHAYRATQLAAESGHVNAVVAFAEQAWRRPLAQRESHALRALYHHLRAEDTAHDAAVRFTLCRILTSPAFLYRLESPGAGPAPTELSGIELASRLSYFLWSSAPDAELLAVAATGELREPDELAAQAKRMLHDPRTRRLAIEFACQWIHVRGFDELDEKSTRHFPTFAALKSDMYKEAIEFFGDLFRADRSVLSILSADHTFLNERLADHYGVPDVEGNAWRRVDVGAHGRGGILTFAATLARQSGASRTSPILRGNWITETILGEKLPNPPQGVPPLPDEPPRSDLTMRELVERHTKDEACSGCHRKIDPYGFALEEFDAIGRRRSPAMRQQTFDTAVTLPDGTRLRSVEGLRQYLSGTRRQAFLRQFSRKLLGYALGRAIQVSDEAILAAMTAALNDNEHRVSAAIEAIVRSQPFRFIRGRDFADAAEN